MSWSTARISDVVTPRDIMISALLSIRPWVWLSCGDGLSVQLMKRAVRSSKRYEASVVGAVMGAGSRAHDGLSRSDAHVQALRNHDVRRPLDRVAAGTSDRRATAPRCHDRWTR